MMQASMSAYPPRSSSWILPPPASSAGVPRRTIVPGTSCASSAALIASATATPDMAMRLCPQPWPMLGSASISEFMPMTRVVLLVSFALVAEDAWWVYVARKAVSSPR